jgi:adenosylcobinamide-phosphate synthase
MVRVLVVLLAVILDLSWGDPPNRFHPLMLMGRWLSWGRRLAPTRQRFWFGAGWTLAGLALFTLPWFKVENKTKPWPFFLIQPLLLKPLFAYRNLRSAVQAVAAALASPNLPEARRLLGWHLVSRDTSDLSEEEVAGAAIESLAENLTDSLATPLLAYAAGGLPAAWAYRFANTSDAMWGYRTAEFEQLGKFAARLDDVLNWLPARLVGWLLALAAWLAGEDAGRAVRVMWAQHSRTASPNAGWTMSAMAGALGVTLSKRGVYNLAGGSGPLDVAAIQRALRLADIGAGLSLVVAILVAILRCRQTRPIRKSRIGC